MDNLSIEKDFVCEILVPGVVAAAALSKEERRRKMRKKFLAVLLAASLVLGSNSMVYATGTSDGMPEAAVSQEADESGDESQTPETEVPVTQSQQAAKEVNSPEDGQSLSVAGESKAVQESSEGNDSEVVQESVEENGSEDVQEPVEENGSEVVQEPVEENGSEDVQEPVKENGSEDVQEPSEENASEDIQESSAGNESKDAQNVTEDTVSESALDSDNMNIPDNAQTSEDETVPEETQTPAQGNSLEDVQESEQNAGTEAQSDSGYDVTPPVIEEVQVPQEGQTLTQADTVQVRVKAYDADSSISEVSAIISLSKDQVGISSSSKRLSLIYNQETGWYEGAWSLENAGLPYGSVEYITCMDENNNYVYWEQSYDFLVEIPAAEPYSLTAFRFDGNGKTYHFDEYLEFSASLDRPVDENCALHIVLRSPQTDAVRVYRFQKAGEKDFSFKRLLIDDPIYELHVGEWKIDAMYVYDDTNGREIPVDLQEWTDQGFELVPDAQEPEEPQEKSSCITYIDLDKNGQTLHPGDNLTITIGINTSLGIEYNERVYVTFCAAVVNAAAEDQEIEMQLNEEKTAYTVTYTIPDTMYPCEWYMDHVGPVGGTDQNGNWIVTDLREFFPNYDNILPYYFNVENGGTLVQPTVNLAIDFIAKDEDGLMYSAQKIVKKNVPRRVTLKDLGITFPEVNTSFKDPGCQGMQLIGWRTKDGVDITEDTQMVATAGWTVIQIAAYAVYDRTPVSVNYDYFTESGESSRQVIEILPPNATYGDLREYLLSKPELEKNPNASFQEWRMPDYYDDSQLIVGNAYVTATAVYDSLFVNVVYRYMDQENDWSQKTQVIQLPKNSTYKDLVEKASEFTPEDHTDQAEFQEWEYSVGSLNQPVPEDEYMPFWMDAVYRDKVVVQVGYDYISEEGAYERYAKNLLLDQGTTYEELQEITKTLEVPKSYPGMEIVGWDYESKSGEITENYSLYWMTPKYDKALISYYIDERYEDPSGEYFNEETSEYIERKVVKKGAEETLPTALGDYIDLQWKEAEYYPDGIFQVNGDYFKLHGYGTYTGEQPEVTPTPTPDPGDPETTPTPTPDPGDPETTPTPTPDPGDPETTLTPTPDPGDPETTPTPTPDPGDPETTPTPTPDPGDPEATPTPDPENSDAELPDPVVDQVISEIINAEDGAQIVVSMDDSTVISSEILEAAKGKNVELVLNMGSYQWIIKGTDIAASVLQDINMTVEFGTDNIPQNILAQISGGKPVYQISLEHEGDFGFRAELSFHIDAEYAGKIGNLFYYDSDGKLIYIDAGRIGTDGEISLTFSHASDYAVVISEEQMNSSQSDRNEGDGNDQKTNSKDGDAKQSGGAETGDTTPVMLWIALFAFAALLTGRLIYQRKKRV